MPKIPRSRQKTHLADMSLPPEQRRRKPKTTRKKGKGAITQMSHGNSPYGTERRRDFERKHGRGKRGAPTEDHQAPEAGPSPEPKAT